MLYVRRTRVQSAVSTAVRWKDAGQTDRGAGEVSPSSHTRCRAHVHRGGIFFVLSSDVERKMLLTLNVFIAVCVCVGGGGPRITQTTDDKEKVIWHYRNIYKRGESLYYSCSSFNIILKPDRINRIKKKASEWNWLFLGLFFLPARCSHGSCWKHILTPLTHQYVFPTLLSRWKLFWKVPTDFIPNPQTTLQLWLALLHLSACVSASNGWTI